MRNELARKGAAEIFDQFLALDAQWRDLQARVDELRAATRPKAKPSPEELVALGKAKDALRDLEAEFEALAKRRDDVLARIPNPPDPSTPDGSSEEDALELRRVGAIPQFSFPVRDHLELGGFDTERAAKLSGARFAYRMGETALLELSLYRYALEQLCARDFVPVLPPVLVHADALYGTGFLPTEESNLYRVGPDEDLYLTGTSEVALAGLHQGEILPAEDLPLHYAGYSTCFRREAGAAGRDTRGIFRVHQFDKVEMFVFTTPERSQHTHEEILSIEEAIVSSLGLSYRVVNTAAGDLGPSASKKYDIEAWIPSQERYREITSCSNTTDFQARRLNVRYRANRELSFVHTLNGTAMTARFLVALLETFQDERGAVAVPDVLVNCGAPRRLEKAG